MKKLILLLFISVGLFASEINWSKDYDSALAKAKKESKLVLVLVTTEDCRWCRKLEATTLKDERVTTKLNSKFSSVHVTRDVDKYPSTIKAPMVPMSVFLNSDGKIVHQLPGFWDGEDYNLILDDAIRKSKK